MKKNFAILPALLAGAAATAPEAGAALSVPWSETFETADAFNAFTLIDANDDGNKWEFNNTGCARIRYNSDLAMDDWLISPAITLTGGKNYKFTIDAAMTSFGPEKIEVKAGNAATVAAMTVTVIPVTEVNNNNLATFTGEFSVPQSGDWHIGVHGCSDPDMLYLTVDNLTLTEGTSSESPTGLGDFRLTPDASGLHKVTVSGVLPAVNAAGNPVNAIEKVEITCDRNLVATVTEGLVPGAQFSYTHEDAPAGQHAYAAVVYADGARGQEVSASVFVGPNIPSQIPWMGVGEFSPGDVTIRWRAPETDADGNPLNPDLVTYKVVRYEVMEGSMFYQEDIEGADNITGTEYVHHAIDADKGQMFTAYGVIAKTEAGSSSAAKTPLFPVGTPYAAPFRESFAAGQSAMLFRSETIDYNTVTPSWDAIADANSNIASYDGDGGYLAMSALSSGDCARLYSGKIDISALAEPVLSFYVYNYYNGKNAEDLNELEVYVSDGTQFSLCKDLIVHDLPANGWNRVTVDLAAYKGKTVQIAFEAVTRNYTVTAIDCIEIADVSATDLGANSVALPARVTTGQPFTATVRVENAGRENVAAGYAVELYRDGEKVQTARGPAIVSCGVAFVEFTETVDVFNTGSEVSYHAEVVADGDGNAANNATPAAVAALIAPAHPAPAALAAVAEGADVALTWMAPSLENVMPEVVTDDFESYESFTQTDAGGWLFVDNDGALPGKLEGISVPGVHDVPTVVPVSFWVMDANIPNGNALFEAHSGARYLAQIFNNDGSQCDDWAISPRLYGTAQTISFYAKSYSSYMSESMEVLYSTTGTALSDFVSVREIAEVPNVWTEYEVSLPEGALYFALRCTSTNMYQLFIDDVTYLPGSATSDLELTGYNVYRNGVKVNDAPVTGTAYTDAAVPGGTHTYNVTALYNRGESLPSDGCPVSLVGLTDVVGDNLATATGADGAVIVRAPAPCHASVFTVDGRLVATADVDGTARIPAAPGIYVVKAGTTVAKVTVR